MSADGYMFDCSFSPFSLMMLSDTNWFAGIDYNYAFDNMNYGRNRGCDFLDSSYDNLKCNSKTYSEFCA
jgi:hypothetical protein